jgi:gluconokinase
MQPIVVMGASGSGKSTVGELLARHLDVSFVDGDDLHPIANKQKMSAGIALNDQDRAPWLDAVAAVIAQGNVVLACSALRRRYRDRLRKAAPALALVYLSGSRELLAERLTGRHHQFMPAKLLDSQLQTLEIPDADEQALTVEILSPPAAIVDRIIAAYSRAPAGSGSE